MVEYLKEGFLHISDLNGYDHILFLVALAVPYRPEDWKRLLGLITAFTVGHSLTLVLAAGNWVTFSAQFIEFLIPLTILITAVLNFIPAFDRKLGRKKWVVYVTTIFFGLIHGLGFSNFLREIMGADGNWLPELIGFNIGLEIGQIIIVGAVLAATYLMVDFVKIKQKYWIWVVSGIVAGFAVYLIANNKIW